MLTGTIVGSVEIISHNYQTLALIEHENRIVSANNNRAVIFQLKDQYPTLTINGFKTEEYIKFILTGEAILIERSQINPTGELITLMMNVNKWISFDDYEIAVLQEDDSTDGYIMITNHKRDAYKITASTIREYNTFCSVWSKKGLTLSVMGTPLSLNCDQLQPFSFPVSLPSPEPLTISKCAIVL